MAPTRSRLLVPLLILALLALGAGLWLWLKPPVPKPLQQVGALRLVPTAFARLPGWAGSDPAAALAAFRRSCAVLLAKPAAAAMGGAGYAGTAADWREPCRALPTGPMRAASARAFFQHWFQPVQVQAGSEREGLFTGYYEPQIAASRSRHGPYRIPVYGEPSDLVTVDLGQFREKWANEKIAGRVVGHRLVPYPDRAEIDAKGLTTAPVLFYAKDPIAVFFLQIQGSGRVAFADGSMARVAYAGQNGRPYTAIGRTLIAEGAIPRAQVSLQSIRAWLESHPADAARVMQTNASYVFFRLAPLDHPELGSEGAEGVALTPEASLAVDLRLHPLGAPFFIAATAPAVDPARPDRRFNRLLIAQDTGGAIRGAVRGDVFWGFGANAASVAGRMKAHGALYVLLPKALAARLGNGKTYPGTRS